MNHSSSFNETRELLHKCASLALVDDEVKRVVAWALPQDEKSRLAEKLGRLRELPDALDRPLRLAVCGENNAGKSTLINALIGEEIAIVNFMEFTFCPMVFRYGPERRAEIIDRNGTITPVDIEDLEGVLTKMKDRGDSDKAERIIVELPIEKLKKYELADVPGLGADERNALVAQSFAEKIDAVIFVLNAGLIGQSEMTDELTELGREFSELAIVVNKIDQIGLENANRIVEYMREQKLGREFPVFPMCAAELVNESSESPIPAQWMAEFQDEFISNVETDALNVQAQTALSKCQRDLAAIDAMLQSAYHLATRVFDLKTTVEEVLDAEESTLVDSIHQRIRNWVDREAFLNAAAEVRQKLKEAGSVSKSAVQAMLSDAFSDSVMDTESSAFSAIVNESRALAWQKVGAKTSEKCGDTQSAFQLEKTLQLVKKERSDAQQLVTSTQSTQKLPEVESEVWWMTRSIVTSEDRKQDGTLSQEDVGGAGALGVLAGGGAAAALATWGGAASFMTALSGVGLPLAAVTGAVALGARWLDRQKKQRPETSVAELAEIANSLRRSAAEKVVEAHFPNGVYQTFTEEIRESVEACKAKMKGLLWSESSGVGDLVSLKQVIGRFENQIASAAALRTSLYGNAVDSVASKASPAANRAIVLYGRNRRLGVDETERLREELSSVFSLEDTQLSVLDRGLSGYELAWLRDCLPSQAFLRVFIYDAESNADSRSEFAHALERIRNNEQGEVTARAVKLRNENRTPLDRVLVFGSDWAIELSCSLSEIGHREMTTRKMTEVEEQEMRSKYLQKYGSVEAFTDHDQLVVADL